MSLFGDDDLIFDDDLENEKEELAPNIEASSSKLLTPQNNPICLGHEKQEKLFLDLFEKGSLPHAMIFSGPKGIGKTTMAFRLARFLLKHGIENISDDSLLGLQGIDLKHSSLEIDTYDPVFSRLASGGHQDFRYIERGFNSDKGKQDSAVKVDVVRKIEPFLRMKSSNGGWRVAIIEDADTMNRNAQNAILKILEEPPPKVLLILIAHRQGALIPTIRSRSRMVPFSSLSDENMDKLLALQGYSLERSGLNLLHKMSKGSIGQALRLAEEGGLEIFKTIFRQLDDSTYPNWVSIHELANELSQATQDKDYRLFTEIFEWIFRELLFAKARGHNAPPAHLDHAKLQALMRGSSIEKLIKIADDLKILYARTDFSNLDRRDAVRSSFLVISQ